MVFLINKMEGDNKTKNEPAYILTCDVTGEKFYGTTFAEMKKKMYQPGQTKRYVWKFEKIPGREMRNR